MDTFSRKKRSDIMRRVRSTGTRPEMMVHSIVKGLRVRFRTCPSDLPGKPDLVFYRKRKAILVHGCFWHRHTCEAAKLPKSNRAYWNRKQARNALRDAANARLLRSRGWKVMALWECQIRPGKRLESRISRFLRSTT
ncbi:MAG: very short patch repair endonuclease [Candidatus Acidiferrales bacterium]